MSEDFIKKIERIGYYREWACSITKNKKEYLDNLEIIFGKECKDDKTWSTIQKTEKFKDFVKTFYCNIDWVIYEIKTIEDERGIGMFTPSDDPDFNDFLQRMQDSDENPFLFIEISKENKNKKESLIQQFNALKRFLEEKYPSFDLSRIHEENSLGEEIQKMKKNSGMGEMEFRGILKNFYVESCDFRSNCYKDECLKIEKEVGPDILELEKEIIEIEKETQPSEKGGSRDPLADALIFAFGFVILLVIVDLFV